MKENVMDQASKQRRPAAKSRANARASCKCWHEKDSKIREMGFKISDDCSALQIEELSLIGVFGLPLQRTDGKKLKKDDPKMIYISHCPFCGQKL